MHKTWPLLFVLFAASIGCDGRQKGEFAVSGTRVVSLETHVGSLTILSGNALTNDYQPVGPDKLLLYCLIVCPGLQSSGSGHEGSDASYVSTRKFKWFAQPSDVVIQFSWDRKNDTVEIHGKQYNRTDGNVFVVIRDPLGAVESSQIDSVTSDLDPFEAMRRIRNFTDDDLIANVRLHPKGDR